MNLNNQSPAWCKIETELGEITDTMSENDLGVFIQWRRDKDGWDIHGGGETTRKAVELQKILWEIESLLQDHDELSMLKKAIRVIREVL